MMNLCGPAARSTHATRTKTRLLFIARRQLFEVKEMQGDPVKGSHMARSEDPVQRQLGESP